MLRRECNHSEHSSKKRQASRQVQRSVQSVVEGCVGRRDGLLHQLSEAGVLRGVARDLPGLQGVGMPRWFICPTRLLRSWELTSEPSTATPVAAPTTRLVFAAEAAMPDRSAGTADMTAEVIGTTVVPIPMPARPSVAMSGP
jgi:hypothetical protein